MAELMITGEVGRLQGKYLGQKNPLAPVVLILHPHPQGGGSMNTRAVFSLYKTFSSLGMGVLRMNFRGVGESQGTSTRGEGELMDAMAGLNWLQARHPKATSIWVAGVSFGSWIGLQLIMRRPEITNFVALSPPANLYDFSFLAPCPITGLFVQGDRDRTVCKDSVLRLVQRLTLQRNLHFPCSIIKNGDHLFSEHLDEVMGLVSSYVAEVLGAKRQAFSPPA